MMIDDPYHEGELAAQQRANESEMARNTSRMISTTIVAGALRFIEQQPMLVIGSIDANGRVWASMLFGLPGFVRALDDRTLEINGSQSRSANDDPLWSHLSRSKFGEKANVGLLVIELGTRRRIRINGHVRNVSTERIIIDVDRAYPNCPKYIQRRVWTTIDNDHQQTEAQQTEASLATSPSHKGIELNEMQKTLITGADTFFVASAHPDHGVDASHRGGQPGFVQILNNSQLRIPDFAGNSMFNTLGNFVSYPYAGLVFIDFERGRILQLTGQPEILWAQDDAQDVTGGTQRFWQFDITGWQESALLMHLAWAFMDASPHIPKQQ